MDQAKTSIFCSYVPGPPYQIITPSHQQWLWAMSSISLIMGNDCRTSLSWWQVFHRKGWVLICNFLWMINDHEKQQVLLSEQHSPWPDWKNLQRSYFLMYLDSFCRWDVRMFSWSLKLHQHRCLKCCYILSLNKTKLQRPGTVRWLSVTQLYEWSFFGILQMFQKVWSAFRNRSKTTQTLRLGGFCTNISVNPLFWLHNPRLLLLSSPEQCCCEGEIHSTVWKMVLIFWKAFDFPESWYWKRKVAMAAFLEIMRSRRPCYFCGF